MNDIENEVQGIIGGKKKTGNMAVFAAGLVILLIIFAGGYFLLLKNNSGTKTNGSGKVMGERSVGLDTEINVSADANGSVIKEILITGGNYKFNPSTFNVKKGQAVKLVFNNTEGFHDLVFDNLDIRTKQMKAGESETVEFTAPDEAGEYTFYCSVGQHRQMGMVGKMVVE